MKMNLWLIIGLTLSTSLLAQQLTNPPPAAPVQAAAPDTNVVPAAVATTVAPITEATNAAPKALKKTAKKPAKQPAAKKKAPSVALHTTPLVAGPALVVASNVNVRAQAKLRSEVVTKVNKGQELIVLEEIVKNTSAEDEPSAWAKILLPPSTPAWVNSSFLSNNVVVPRLLNVRGGPGENYSVIGTIPRGTTITPQSTKDQWTQIEAPANAFGFVAAQYLKQEAAPLIASATPPAKETTAPAPEAAAPAVPETPAATEQVAEAPAMAPAPTETPAVPAPPVAESTAPAVAAPAIEAPSSAIAGTDTNMVPGEVMEEPLPKRIVQREGIVRGTTSIQAPTHFALVSPNTGRLIDYLYSSSPSLDLRRYKGIKVAVTGEEALEERWGNTPVITIETLDVLDE